MPIRIFLSIQAAVMGTAMLLSSPGFALDSGALLEFLGAEHSPVFALLPSTLTVEDNFQPSKHPFAGTVNQVQGVAYVYHKDDAVAYTLKKDLPLFNGDTLVTGEKSRLTVQMADESLLTLTAETKLTIDRSLPQVKIRDTVLQLFFGRVRSLVKKLSGEYTVRTPTVTVGVRGTDFALAVAPAPANKGTGWLKNMPIGFLTAVLTGGGQSTVELAGPFGTSVTVKPLSVAGVRTGGLIEKGTYVGPAAEALLQKIAPLPDSRLAQANKYQPSLKPPAATAPCWPLSFKPQKELKFFRICE